MTDASASASEVPWPPVVSGVADALQSHHDAIRDEMHTAADHWPGQSETESRQFVVGYVNVIIACARGDSGPVDEYLEAVVPSCKAAGMPLDYLIAALVTCQQALTAAAPQSARKWAYDFGSAYARRFVRKWDAS